jgi:hypothetical protein
MSKKALVPVNLLSFSAAPTTPTPVSGDCYWDTTLSALRVYNGTTWVNANTASGGGVSYYAQAASATLLVLTSASARNILITATAGVNQEIQLPNASTMTLGDAFYITNGSATDWVYMNTADTLFYSDVNPTYTIKFTCILASGTTGASWQGDWISGALDFGHPIISRIMGLPGGDNELFNNLLVGTDIEIGTQLTGANSDIFIGNPLLEEYHQSAELTFIAEDPLTLGVTKQVFIAPTNDTSPTQIFIGPDPALFTGACETFIFGTVALGSATTKTTAYPVAPTGTTTGTVTESAQLAGYLGMPQNAKAATGTFSYTLLSSDAGKHIYYTGTPTSAALVIPANTAVAFEIGTTIVVMNDLGAATSISISITTNTLQLAGTGATGTRTLARYGVATITKVTATKWIISGNGLT